MLEKPHSRVLCQRMETMTDTKPLPASLRVMTDAEFARRMKIAARKAKKANTKKWRGF